MSKNNGFFLRCRVASQETVARFLRRRVACQETMAVFCAAGLQVKKRWPVFCAAGLHVKKRWPVFCAAGLHVKKRWPFSAPQGCTSKNDGRFLRRRVARQKFLNRLMLAVQLRAPNESSACNWTLRKADSSSHNLCFLLTGNFHNPNV